MPSATDKKIRASLSKPETFIECFAKDAKFRAGVADKLRKYFLLERMLSGGKMKGGEGDEFLDGVAEGENGVFPADSDIDKWGRDQCVWVLKNTKKIEDKCTPLLEKAEPKKEQEEQEEPVESEQQERPQEQEQQDGLEEEKIKGGAKRRNAKKPRSQPKPAKKKESK